MSPFVVNLREVKGSEKMPVLLILAWKDNAEILKLAYRHVLQNCHVAVCEMLKEISKYRGIFIKYVKTSPSIQFIFVNLLQQV